MVNLDRYINIYLLDNGPLGNLKKQVFCAEDAPEPRIGVTCAIINGRDTSPCEGVDLRVSTIFEKCTSS